MPEMAASAAASSAAKSSVGVGGLGDEKFGVPSSVNLTDMRAELMARPMVGSPVSASSAASRNLKTAIAFCPMRHSWGDCETTWLTKD